jgi:hypothetical protein
MKNPRRAEILESEFANRGPAGPVGGIGTIGRPISKSADVPFSDYEYEMAMLETELELEWDMASRADGTD